MPIHFPPKITREYLLSRVSEEEVFEKYGVRVDDGLFRSPLRLDRHPTCRFYRNRNGRLTLHDFAGFFHGDCFDFVMKTQGMNYPSALEDIARRFKILSGETRTPERHPVTIEPKPVCEIRIGSQPWDALHIEWWADYGVDMELLEKFNVVPVRHVWLNGKLYYNRDFSKTNEVVFAYRFGGYDYKIYFPMRKERRFLHSNPDILQGWNQLPETNEFIVITKSMKDVICLAMFNIPAIAPMGETTHVSDSVLEILKERFDRLYALYDRDPVGKRALVKFRKRGVTPLLMPLGTTKDFADLCKKDLSSAQQLASDFTNSILL